MRSWLPRSNHADNFDAIEVGVGGEEPGDYAIGKLGILAGLPDEGKGQVLADMAARTTRASEWPCGEGFAPLGNVILLTAEDGIEDTALTANGHGDCRASRSKTSVVE